MTAITMAVKGLGLGSFTARLKSLHKDWEKYRAYRTTVKELSQLTDHELRDIGISRGMIHSVAMEIYYGKGWV